MGVSFLLLPLGPLGHQALFPSELSQEFFHVIMTGEHPKGDALGKRGIHTLVLVSGSVCLGWCEVLLLWRWPGCPLRLTCVCDHVAVPSNFQNTGRVGANMTGK